jgi:hypothetical protein
VTSAAQRRAAAAAHHLQHEENVLRRDYGRLAVAVSFVFMNTICHDVSGTSVYTLWPCFKPCSRKKRAASGGEKWRASLAIIRFQITTEYRFSLPVPA